MPSPSGASWANETLSLKSSRYSASSPGLYRVASAAIHANSRLVLPEPLGPPINACGEASSRTRSTVPASANPTGARSPVVESFAPHSSWFGRRSANVLTRPSQLSCSTAMAWQPMLTCPSGNRASGVTRT